MSKEKEVPVAYCGSKAREVDWKIAHTGIVWNGPGDVQMVPESAVAKLLKHPDVWAVVIEPPVTPVIVDNDTIVDLDAMDKGQLAKFALAAFGMKLDLRKSVDDLRKQVRAAMAPPGVELTA